MKNATVNRGTLKEQIAANHGISKAKAGRIVDEIFNTISAEVAKGNAACITGFGTFEAVERKAKVGRNPQNGEPINIPATTAPRFRAGSDFKKAVKQ